MNLSKSSHLGNRAAAVNSSHLLINRLLPLSHHLAARAVRKTNATSAVFTARFPDLLRSGGGRQKKGGLGSCLDSRSVTPSSLRCGTACVSCDHLCPFLRDRAPKRGGGILETRFLFYRWGKLRLHTVAWLGSSARIYRKLAVLSNEQCSLICPLQRRPLDPAIGTFYLLSDTHSPGLEVLRRHCHQPSHLCPERLWVRQAPATRAEGGRWRPRRKE